MKKILILNALLILPSLAVVNVPLTVQEALPVGTTGCSTPGACGVSRAQEPFTVGVPLPDDSTTGATSTSVFGLSGCSAGQFRTLGTWPSGRIKWLEVSGIVATISAGSTQTCTLTSTGSGNFGGADLATDGPVIVVATGTSTYHVKKANFNLLDYVDVGATHIVSPSSDATRGLVLTGPASPNTDCTGGCANAFSSSNDANSTCMIEENGPVKAVLKCFGDLMDGTGHVYLHHTTRLTFWQNKDAVKAHIELRNADNNATAFNRAYKGFAAFEAKLDLATTGTNRYSFGGKAGTVSGTFSGSEDATLVQLYSKYLEGTGIGVWDTANIAENSTQSIIPRSSGGGCTDPYCYPNSGRSLEGYTIKDGATVLERGTRTDTPAGWCNVENGAGQGALAGVWYLAAYWPKSCELNGGGNNLVVGIWPRQINGFNYWIAWPQYQIHDIFFDFHSAPLSSNDNTFKSLQYNLIARPPLSQYNISGVLPPGMTLPDPVAEDNFYKSIATADGVGQNYACCVTDTSASSQAQTYRIYAWGQGSAANQAELRWANLLLFVSRGFTGRYVNSEMFYRFVEEQSLPRSDFANGWRGSGASLSMSGFPNDSSTGSANTMRLWIDRLHAHVYGIFDYYFMTGDESIKDTISQGFSDWLLNTGLTNNAANGPQRAIGVYLMAVNRMHDYQMAIGDPIDSATGVKGSTEAWNNAELALNSSVRPVMNTRGPFGSPCSAANCAGPGDYGTDPVRGVTWPQGAWTAWDSPPASGNNNPGGAGTSRNTGQLQEGILIEGIMEYAMNRGSSWAAFEDTMDLALANGMFVRNELTVSGNPVLLSNGTRFGIALDYCNDPAAPCSAGTHNTYAVYFAPNAFYYTMAILHQYWGDTAWVQSFKDNLYQAYYSTGAANMSEQSVYSMASLVYRALNPSSAPPLVDIPITGFVDNGGGSYTIRWTAPAAAQSYKFKWGTKPIVNNMQFDPGQTLTYGVDPASHQTWWSARNVSDEPAPAAAGTTQLYTFTTGTTGLTADCFSLKAYTTGSSGGTGAASRLVLVSGNGQAGTAGQVLATPFTVQVTDSGGNPVSGTTVTFAVTAGGGTLTAGTVATNSSGLASTTLTLGTAGTNTVTATSGTLTGSPITFTATGTSAIGPASKLVLVSGNGQSGTVALPLASPFTVQVTDASGTPVSGTTVTFTVTAGAGALTAASVATNSSGLASTTLTLGAAVGTNVVTAASGALTGSPITFTAVGAAVGTSSSVSWVNQTATSSWPTYVGWLSLPYDPISQQTLLYVGPPSGSHGIYSTDLYAYAAGSNRFTHIGGTGSAIDACPLDTLTQPGDRHPVSQMAIDTKRNVLWLYGGLNVNCSAPSGPNANPRQDMYYLTLNADPLNDVWHQITPVHIPLANSASALVYDPDDDVLFAFGSDSGSQTHTNWVYCRTVENPTPGVLTPKQSAAGCAAADDWSEITTVGGVQPLGVSFPGMVYDTVTKKVIQYGGMSGSLVVSYNQTWAYDVPTRQWTQKALSTTAPPLYNGGFTAQPALAYNMRTNKVVFHQTTNSGAPADWQYDPLADTWTRISGGGGAATDQVMTYDNANSMLIGFNLNSSSGLPEIWQGSFSSAAPPVSSRCDLNGDGVVDAVDVQAAINQTLGVTACGNADLTGDGLCTIVDVQRIINASLGGACRIGN